MGQLTEKDFKRIKVEKATTPISGYNFCYTDRWWIVKDGAIMFYRGSAPQCNSKKEIAESIRDRLFPGADVQYLPAVFVESDRH